MTQTRQFVLAETPTGKLAPDHFRLETADVPAPGEGEVLVKALYVSLDAANRAWMQGATYRDAVEAGTVMAGGGLGEVVESNDPAFTPGDLVTGDFGWREMGVHGSKDLTKLPRMEPLSHLLSIYGVTGLTAYFGLLEVSQPRAGETVVVSAAAGAVGNVVGQIAKIKGCRVVGIAGTDEKCAWLKDDLGFDEAINYKTGPLHKSLKAACPDGIDVYFDNVGGDVFEAVLFQMNMHGRIACCGAVSAYDGTPPASGPRGEPSDGARLHRDGFLRQARPGSGRPARLGRVRPTQGGGRCSQRLRDPARRPDWSARRRKPRQAHGKGGVAIYRSP